jgi:hypothetical protein
MFIKSLGKYLIQRYSPSGLQALRTNAGNTDIEFYTPSAGAGNFGITAVNFGSGKTDASVAVTGQAGILSGSTVLAKVAAKATFDHSIDEHVVEELTVLAGNIVAGTGFTIYARTGNIPLTGQWNVAWTWG